MNEWRFRKPKKIVTMDIHWACIKRTSNSNIGPNFKSDESDGPVLSYVNDAIYSSNELSLRTKFFARKWFPCMCGIKQFGCNLANIPHLSKFCVETEFWAITRICFKQLQRKLAINVYSSVIVIKEGSSLCSFFIVMMPYQHRSSKRAWISKSAKYEKKSLQGLKRSWLWSRWKCVFQKIYAAAKGNINHSWQAT